MLFYLIVLILKKNDVVILLDHFKNHKHVKKVGHTSEFSFLAFIDELEKQIIIKKTVEWANKKDKIILNIYNVLFKKIIKKNTCRYHYQNLDDIIYMIYSSSDMSKTY